MRSFLVKYFGSNRLSGPIAWLGSLLVTIGLYFWLLHLRSGVYDPFGLPIFWHLVIFQDYWAALLMIPSLCVALVPAIQQAASRLVEAIGRNPLACAAVVVTLLAVGAKLVYHAHPLSMDEYAAVFQGRIFAEGRLTGKVPPQLVDWVVPERFQGRFINASHETGQLASVYWPGFALLIAPLAALDVPWLVNPLIAGAILLVVNWVVLKITQDRVAVGLALLLTIASQAYSVNGISFYSMNAHLLVNLVFAGLLMTPTRRNALLAGLVGSVGLSLHNPVPHVLFAVPWIVWLLTIRCNRSLVLPLMAGYLPLCVLLGIGWPALAAHLFAAASAGSGEVSFVAAWAAKLGNVFRFPDQALLVTRFAGIAKLWLWAVPGLMVLAVIGWWRQRGDVRVRLLSLSAILTIVGFCFVRFDQGHGWGFRYFQSAWGVLPILAALAVSRRASTEAQIDREPLGREGRVVASVAITWLIVGTCLRFYQVASFIDHQLAQLPRHGSELGSVLIINSVGGYYALDLVQNDPFLRGRIILASNGRQHDADMMAALFPQLHLVAADAAGQVWERLY